MVLGLGDRLRRFGKQYLLKRSVGVFKPVDAFGIRNTRLILLVRLDFECFREYKIPGFFEGGENT
jgi:hypothetical protein